jgi:lipopolysaccharide biosynthesis protein
MEVLVEIDTRAGEELAANYGLYGFCYFHYWFHGRRILERPINEMWKSGEPNFPFCLCWANENWTRWWDGLNSKILLEQKYRPEDDLSHIRSLIPIFFTRLRTGFGPSITVYRNAGTREDGSPSEARSRARAVKQLIFGSCGGF